MNIFILDQDLQKNAEYHVDKHVVKMILEQTQLLSSVYYFTNEPAAAPYRLTHKNHPCAKWVRESLSNWKWLKNFTIVLANEYTYRYGKYHKSGELAKDLPDPELIDIGITPFPQAMPVQYQDEDPVKAYRSYYLGEKSHLFSWKKRQIPKWVVEEMKDEVGI